ncbi:hypothetical protein [Ferruginibacter sp. HRS2-29]|uniref:hypothetical protein n=1 Tax=Ferruginibacter sp. HRS2-29 TaxID=2487334 RepID=UPI0020CC1F9F|nr:hypothetical protein [Ferruginibacter sp. HRS2-29]MCP9752197.1 hypothetical protein [Ferruginibacter sp. HRS2-29]
MKKLIIATAILYSSVSFAQTANNIPDSAKFNKKVMENTTSFVFDGQKPTGKGWDILEKQFADNQFVAWGEYHNSPAISQLSAYALGSASKYGFRNWCVEVSPFVASELTGIAASKNPIDSLKAISKDHPDYGTFPFFKTTEDAQMLSIAAKNKYKIWGIDQEFQMAFPYCITKAYDAQSPKVKKAYKAVYDSLLARWWMPKVRLIDSLKNATIQPRLKDALEDIKISRTIYYESDNQMRATLMKKNFYNYYDKTTTKNEKVFFKLGANHLAKGLNLMTNLYDIGNAAYELSQRNKTGFVNVYFVNRFYTEKGKVIDDLDNEDSEYPKEFLKLYDKEKWMVVDLRAMRLRYDHDKTISDDAYSILYKYDLVVISPEVMK